MKPAPFSYVAATSVDQAVAALAEAGEQGKIIAGGQSLMPMINFRLVRPSVLVDINRIEGLDRIEDLGDCLRIGALVRHRMTASDRFVAERVPVLHEAMKHVAHHTVRNRGTFCGSICHADPAAELPMIALLLNGLVEIAGPGGMRRVSVREFLVAPLTTALAANEMVTAIEIEKQAPDTGWGFAEFARRQGDYALACVAATTQRREGLACDVRIAAMGIADTALRLDRAEQALDGTSFAETDILHAAALLREDVQPITDLNGSSDYRRHLAGNLAEDVLRQAWRRASESVPA